MLAIVGNPLFVVVRLPLALARLYVYTPLRHVHSLYAFLHSFLPSGVGSLVPDHLLHSPRLTLLFADYLEPPLGYRERLAPKPQESEDWRVTRDCCVAHVILGLVALRVVFVPLFILCNSKSSQPLFSSSDAYPIFIMLVFAVSNGWLTTCIFVHSASVVAPELRQRAGTFVVLFLNTGLALGSMLSFFTRWLVCDCNPFLNDALNATASR